MLLVDGSVTLNPSEVEHLRGILHASWEEEWEDYERLEEEDREDHPFVSLVALRNAIGGDPNLLD